MKRYATVLAVLAILLAGYPLSTFLPQQEAPVSPFVPMTKASQLDAAFASWAERHQASGGDRDVRLGLGWSKGLSTEFTRAHGELRLDLIAGSVAVQVQGLESYGEAEVWLVDNSERPGDSVLPEPGDEMLSLGVLERGDDGWVLYANLGDTFRDFEVDLAVVTPAGRKPTEERLLTGSPKLFQRLYTRTRLGRLPQPAQSARPHPLLAAVDAFAPQPAFASALVPSFDDLIEKGASLFFKETFGGNGRTCGTCHPAEHNFTIDPEFIATLRPDNPLFVAEFVSALKENFEKPKLMRQVGLILENLDGFSDLENRFTMRGVPHTLALGIALTPGAPFDGTTTPPDERTGWSGDGAPGNGTLREFAIGAVTQHFPKSLGRVPNVDFVLPDDSELDAMEAFQLFLGRDDELNLSTMVLKGAVPARGLEIFLAGDTQGGTVAAGKCNNCHFNAGANVASGLNFNFDTGVEALADQPADLIDPANNPPDGGFGQAVNPNGGFGDGTFNTPVIVEAADTGPFFHNNSIETIEEAVNFYNSNAFANSPSGQFLASGDSGGIGIELEATQVVAVAAFLRVVNALENIRSADETARFVLGVFNSDVAGALLALAVAEVEDGIEVLDCGGLHPAAQAGLDNARVLLLKAAQQNNQTERNTLIQSALETLKKSSKDMAA